MQAPSLTSAFKALPTSFSVRLLHLGNVSWQAHEAGLLNLATAVAPYGREVLLCLDDTPVVWARSVCAGGAKQWRGLLDCGTQPLGARLFDGSLPLVRTPFSYARAEWPDCGQCEPLWMRRSVFEWQGEPLWLGEAFLPALALFLPAPNKAATVSA